MAFPVIPVLPEINTSANKAVSQWNSMVRITQKQIYDSLFETIRTGGVGSDLSVSDLSVSDASNSVLYDYNDGNGGKDVNVYFGSNKFTLEKSAYDCVEFPVSLDDNFVNFIFGVVITVETLETSGVFIGSDGSEIPLFNYNQNFSVEKFNTNISNLSNESISINGIQYNRIIPSSIENISCNVYASETTENSQNIKIIVPLFFGKVKRYEGVFFKSINPSQYGSTLTTNKYSMPLLKTEFLTGDGIGQGGYKNWFDVNLNGNLSALDIDANNINIDGSLSCLDANITGIDGLYIVNGMEIGGSITHTKTSEQSNNEGGITYTTRQTRTQNICSTGASSSFPGFSDVFRLENFSSDNSVSDSTESRVDIIPTSINFQQDGADTASELNSSNLNFNRPYNNGHRSLFFSPNLRDDTYKPYFSISSSGFNSTLCDLDITGDLNTQGNLNTQSGAEIKGALFCGSLTLRGIYGTTDSWTRYSSFGGDKQSSQNNAAMAQWIKQYSSEQSRPVVLKVVGCYVTNNMTTIVTPSSTGIVVNSSSSQQCIESFLSSFNNSNNWLIEFTLMPENIIG